MNLREYKGFFIICVLVLFLILAVYVISSFWPRYEERFFELGLLGRNKKAEDYYLGNSSSVEVGSNITWFIYIHNHMGSSQNVSVRVKLLNSTMQVPDDRKHEPSPTPHFIEFPLSLDTDKTLMTPFSWGFEKYLENGSIGIDRLMVNDQTVNVDASSFSDNRFRMVFELWVYDPLSRRYKFEWDSGKDSYSASLCMWFNVLAKMHVGDISMPYTERGLWYHINFTATILDENDNPVPEATGHLDVKLPNDSVRSFTGETDSDGIVQFRLSSRLTGAYTAQVIDVVKQGWTYDPESNNETNYILTVP